jgi:hypothetical protein
MNPTCGKQVVLDPAARMDSRPRCTCGALMKRHYDPPVFRYLDFLYLEQTVFADRAPHKD